MTRLGALNESCNVTWPSLVLLMIVVATSLEGHFSVCVPTVMMITNFVHPDHHPVWRLAVVVLQGDNSNVAMEGLEDSF